MYVQGLQRMNALLRQVARTSTETRPLKFRLGTWLDKDSACAVGYTMLDPWFREQGLTLWKSPLGYFLPTYDGSIGWRAVEEFFEISADDSLKLFCADNYLRNDRTDPLAVALRIRAMLASTGPVRRNGIPSKDSHARVTPLVTVLDLDRAA